MAKTKDALAAAESYLSETTHACEAKASEWEARQKSAAGFSF